MSHRKTSLLRPFLLAVTLGTGFAMLWWFGLIWLGVSIKQSIRDSEVDAWKKLPPRESPVVTTEGVPLIQHTIQRSTWQQSYRDLKNKPLKMGEDPRQLLPEIGMYGQYATFGFFNPRLDWGLRIKQFAVDGSPDQVWFFVHDGLETGSGYFVGFDKKTNRCLGYIGLAGFRAGSVPAEERIPVRGELIATYSPWSSAPIWGRVQLGNNFEPEPWDLPQRQVFVPSGKQVRLVDLVDHTVSTIFEAPETIEAIGVPPIGSAFHSDPIKKDRPIQVRTRHKVYTIDRKHRVVREFAIPEEIDLRSRVSWYEVGDGRAYAFFAHPQVHGKPREITEYTGYEVAQDGAIRDRHKLTLPNGAIAGGEQEDLMLFDLGMPAPLFQLLVRPLAFMTADTNRTFLQASRLLFQWTWPTMLGTFGLSLALAWLTWRRSRAFGLPRKDRIVWTVFVLLLGLPAYVGYLLHRRWPPRVPCPSCHEKAPRDREACAECGVPFPEPALTGIEIFA